jgi:hypothetical protein
MRRESNHQLERKLNSRFVSRLKTFACMLIRIITKFHVLRHICSQTSSTLSVVTFSTSIMPFIPTHQIPPPPNNFLSQNLMDRLIALIYIRQEKLSEDFEVFAQKRLTRSYGEKCSESSMIISFRRMFANYRSEEASTVVY